MTPNQLQLLQKWQIRIKADTDTAT